MKEMKEEFTRRLFRKVWKQLNAQRVAKANRTVVYTHPDHLIEMSKWDGCITFTCNMTFEH